jgi:hypothetical protein
MCGLCFRGKISLEEIKLEVGKGGGILGTAAAG